LVPYISRSSRFLWLVSSRSSRFVPWSRPSRFLCLVLSRSSRFLWLVPYRPDQSRASLVFTARPHSITHVERYSGRGFLFEYRLFYLPDCRTNLPPHGGKLG
jgi:hypothetical protein